MPHTQDPLLAQIAEGACSSDPKLLTAFKAVTWTFGGVKAKGLFDKKSGEFKLTVPSKTGWSAASSKLCFNTSGGWVVIERLCRPWGDACMFWYGRGLLPRPPPHLRRPVPLPRTPAPC